MPHIHEPGEDPNAVLWRYLRLRHCIGDYCFGWNFDGDYVAFNYDRPAHVEFRDGDA